MVTPRSFAFALMREHETSENRTVKRPRGPFDGLPRLVLARPFGWSMPSRSNSARNVSFSSADKPSFFIDDLAIKAYKSSTYAKESRPQFQIGQAVVMVGEVLNRIRRVSQRRWESDTDFSSWWYTLETDKCEFEATGDHPICEKDLRPLSGKEIGIKYFETWESK